MPARVPYTKASIERALEIHDREGRIQSWKPNLEKADHYLIYFHTQLEPLELRSLREVWIFLHGIMTAKNAIKRVRK